MKTFDDCEHRSASHGANACSISHGHRSPMTRDSELYNLYFILYTLLYDAAENLDPYHHTIKYKDVMSYNAAVCCALDTAGTSTSVVNTVQWFVRNSHQWNRGQLDSRTLSMHKVHSSALEAYV